MTPLEAEIRALIAAEGPMPLARYMALCLGHPRHGYYLTRDPLGAAGDFVTAPEVSQMFGELLGLWAVATWQQMGMPSAFRLVELGPGRGTLMADALRAARLVPQFGAAARIHLVETSPVLRARQKTALAPIAPDWHDRLEDVPPGPMVLLANEFFDALPVSQFVRGPDGWHERRVGLDGAGRLVFGADPRPSPMAAALARRVPPPHPPGAVLEAPESGAAAAVAARLAREGGAALVIDYGYRGPLLGDTFQALRGHRFVDPLEAPGEADLTAHVDFAALARAATGAGARAFGPLPQGEFLMRLGIVQRAERLQQGTNASQRKAILSALARLAGTGKDEMGVLFKVVCLCDPGLGAPPGFAPEEAFAEPDA
ncbi:class I SAM-dependent methyltransferase [Aquabacter spiritensis]|uniref:SAM-dependent MidA family methyltransferase n=1 Tax=Aquabacter spiritensis TaxID=933073 RepID=A0A4R3M7I1_9HYPH|nr:SAM-dependent methyltransferase [Aquabacter spiritensis]TCT08229.1 SAM-dependent MidA family methyltransferase [Aquabacter spiritensis]